MVTELTLCLEIWIKFTETSSALGGIFAALYIQSSETFCGSCRRTLVSSREILFDTAGFDFTHSSQNSLCNTVGTTLHFKGVGGTGLFCHWQPTTPTDKFKLAPLHRSCSSFVLKYMFSVCLCLHKRLKQFDNDFKLVQHWSHHLIRKTTLMISTFFYAMNTNHELSF